jgi:hypothetical protein
MKRLFERFNRPLTKRQLGVLMLVGGALAFAAILSIDIIDAGREGGIGPAQALSLLGCLAVAVVGATLIPLGDKPA